MSDKNSIPTSKSSPSADPQVNRPLSSGCAVEQSLKRSLERLEKSRSFAKPTVVPQVLDLARRLLLQPDGIERLYQLAPRLDEAGIFTGSDWAEPQVLLAGLVGKTLEQDNRQIVIIECISLLRILAIANGVYARSGFSSEQARHFLTQVLAHNLSRFFDGAQTEAIRTRSHGLNEAIVQLFQFLVSHIGYDDILVNLTDEIWRILGERPIQVHHAKAMITQIAVTLADSGANVGDARTGADRLISALFGPTQNCRDDPGIAVYRERVSVLDINGLQQEASGFARAMHDVGLVSDYHADFLRWLLEQNRSELIADALGLSNTGLDGLRCYSDLIYRLIEDAIYPETSQSVYGLAMLLERGVLYVPPVAPALWQQIGLELSEQTAATLTGLFGATHPPRVFLLAGVISVLGQPLGVSQGNNPTCQAARALFMWSFNDPDYLLHLIAQVVRFDRILMQFEGSEINSADLSDGLIRSIPIDNDPVSTLLVPHLDRIYNEMGRLCLGRGEDPHYWINPEFHGWWVGRKFAIAVDIHTGKLKDYDGFVRHFFASYHPLYNGNQPVIHPQPAGLAVTDSTARFVGWHAITILRVALDQTGVMRVYFYNPNNDSGQNWGNGVHVSTQGHGERFGESSLPFHQLASRIYIFHDEPLISPPLDSIQESDVEDVKKLARSSWATER